jgi:hypothetical protein
VEEVVQRMSDNELNGHQRTGEDEHERLNRELLELLQELRVAIPGVQVLFAFLLTVPFAQGFSSVTTLQEYVYFATMLCTAVSTALLIAPSSQHRILWREHEREKRLQLGNKLTVAGLTFLALAMMGAVFLISGVLFGDVVATVAAVGIGLVFAWLWYWQPLRLQG